MSTTTTSSCSSRFKPKVGPAWIMVNQVTAHAAIADFCCDDADEVDHTTFAVRKTSWEFVQAANSSDDRLRLKVVVAIRGTLNKLDSLAFHLWQQARCCGCRSSASCRRP